MLCRRGAARVAAAAASVASARHQPPAKEVLAVEMLAAPMSSVAIPAADPDPADADCVLSIHLHGGGCCDARRALLPT